MKVQIRESFNAPPSATFLVGEVLTVDDKLGQEWIDAGRAVPEGSIPSFVNRPSHAQTVGDLVHVKTTPVDKVVAAVTAAAASVVASVELKKRGRKPKAK